ncbi:diphosphomevalonate decarboxylase [Friedmanniomyces endolithicus]|nr:diphosphomevalonate decarboxylase [Friedmanniomyces endolithicus]
MANADVHHSSTFAPVNIAVIKYWGKRDTALNLPTNSSLSVTLSQDDLRTHTTASCSHKFTKDELVLNGEGQDISGARTQACLRELRGLRKEVEAKDSGVPKLSGMALKIISENNFPTAAGLASSAAGFAALVRAIADLYALPSPPAELSRIARQGSGSACRSLFGGYVAWKMGAEKDGSDSAAYEVAPASHWPDMRALILVASAEKKDVSSTAGMQATVNFGAFHASSGACCARKDDGHGGDSNNFHATCLDTSPPIFYMNDTSRAAVRVCEAINTSAGKAICAYTFDAGPNAVVYYLAETEAQVAGIFRSIVGDKTGWDNSRGGTIQAGEVPKGMEIAAEMLEKGVSRVILTAVGDGPRRTEEHLC